MDVGQTQGSDTCIKIGALAPLSEPGWIDAGNHLIAGLELAAEEVNRSGGVLGNPLKLLIRDTAGDPQKATAAVDELSGLGVAALAGEYHSVVARAVATRATAVRLPYLCSSAVLDSLTDDEQPTGWVARLAPPQSRGWRVFADFLLATGHSSIAVAADTSSVYWRCGSRILREHFASRGGSVVELDMRELTPDTVCDEILQQGARTTALLLLVGQPEPAISIVKAVRRDKRLSSMLISTPAGQAEFAGWSRSLGNEGAVIPFLRYLPDRLSPLGVRIEAILKDRLAETPSFVAFEGYDTVTVLADLLRTHNTTAAPPWSRIAVQGTRGQITFSCVPEISVWQWTWSPIQVADRDPEPPHGFRVLF
ncbi:hypothetical protein QQS21_006938 [Conoideocrella luteorostrata]|uniref:Leucine-binding protein domain-containing protein n=1 Tax=Conoideocrella luteorostrata TaxID=1105319 RepID=A0AAJ0CP10_9HYPO|nr:hypothetical protein QQS21_006938 [Conoideocrella luteorostrata]